MTHRKDVVTFNDITENLDQIPKGDPFARGRGPADPLRERAMADALSAPQLAERVRELEAESAKWKEAFERIRSTNTDLMMQLFDAKEATRAVNISPVLHENARQRAECAALRRELAALMDDH